MRNNPLKKKKNKKNDDSFGHAMHKPPRAAIGLRQRAPGGIHQTDPRRKPQCERAAFRRSFSFFTKWGCLFAFIFFDLGVLVSVYFWCGFRVICLRFCSWVFAVFGYGLPWSCSDPKTLKSSHMLILLQTSPHVVLKNIFQQGPLTKGLWKYWVLKGCEGF